MIIKTYYFFFYLSIFFKWVEDVLIFINYKVFTCISQNFFNHNMTLQRSKSSSFSVLVDTFSINYFYTHKVYVKGYLALIKISYVFKTCNLRENT